MGNVRDKEGRSTEWKYFFNDDNCEIHGRNEKTNDTCFMECKKDYLPVIGTWKTASISGATELMSTMGIGTQMDSSKTMAAPTFLETPKIITLNNGKLVQMIGRYEASEKCHSSWSTKGKPLSNAQNMKIFHEKINSNDYEYRVEIHKPTKANAGLYRCQVKNGFGQMQVYLDLNVDVKQSQKKTKLAPTFIEPPKIIQLNNGNLIQMIARYEASEKVYCNWSKRGTNLSENKNVKIYHEK